MTLPKDFQFNQGMLQDYLDCQRRFQLRYLLKQSWPAVEVEPFLEYERMIDLGSRFHKIIRQYLMGIPESQISESIGNDEEIGNWWSSFNHSLQHGILETIFRPGISRFEEISLSTPIEKYRLVAKYDLLVFQPDGKWIIYDWKTTVRHPTHPWMADRMQTHVYPYVLTLAASSIISCKSVDPDQIEMIYWFANQPDQPERFIYDGLLHDANRKYLETLISTIDQKTETIFALTPDARRCKFCTYRSLCDRGVKPGELHQLEEWQASSPSSEDVSFDYEQIGEIEF